MSGLMSPRKVKLPLCCLPFIYVLVLLFSLDIKFRLNFNLLITYFTYRFILIFIFIMNTTECNWYTKWFISTLQLLMHYLLIMNDTHKLFYNGRALRAK